MVRESLDEGYCDVSGRTGDLDFVGMCSTLSCDFLRLLISAKSTGSMGGIKVFATQGGILYPNFKSETQRRNP